MTRPCPIGIIPRYIHDDQRFSELCEAIARYYNAEYPIPIEWIEEWNEHVERRRVTIKEEEAKMAKRIEQLRAIIRMANEELDGLVDTEEQKLYGPLLGTCYRYRNSYGGDEKKWWLYTRVVKVEGKLLTVLNFQRTASGNYEIETRGFRYAPMDGYEKISLMVFSKAYSHFLDTLAKEPIAPIEE